MASSRIRHFPTDAADLLPSGEGREWHPAPLTKTRIPTAVMRMESFENALAVLKCA